MNTASATPAVPTSIRQYLDQLRHALRDADPAMLQDALYDAEEYLRGELAGSPGRSEAEVVADVAGSYGAPSEVAEIYRDTEVKVSRALRPPPPPQRRSLLGRFFAVAGDVRAWSALFYMALSLATGVFYFTWAVTGVILSAGLSVLIIGIPFVILFLASVRLLSLVEGRMVEVLLGERMPRRPISSASELPLLARIAAMFADPRTWTTLLYMLLMLPLGIVYFSVLVTGISLALTAILVPPAVWFGAVETGVSVDGWQVLRYGDGWANSSLAAWQLPLLLIAGVLLLFVMLHLARAIGRGHGLLAKALLVQAGSRDRR